jgi:hypothetical protein
VQGLRAYPSAVVEAVNSNNPQLPALLAKATARRAGLHQTVYGDELGAFYPGPNPIAVLAVRPVSETQRNILLCVVTAGFVLERPGRQPVSPYKVVGAQYEMLLEDGVWKVNRAAAFTDVSCDGVPIPGIAS